MTYHRRFAHLEGAVLLRDFFAREAPRKGWTQAGFARRIGRTPLTVHFWCTGFRRPDMGGRKWLRKLAGIPESSWLTPKERADEQEAERALR